MPDELMGWCLGCNIFSFQAPMLKVFFFLSLSLFFLQNNNKQNFEVFFLSVAENFLFLPQK